uniref:semaphorin-3A-like n=1 Tax=Myxine glutinosa TaxID=7769 RepID=UPI00358E35A8
MGPAQLSVFNNVVVVLNHVVVGHFELHGAICCISIDPKPQCPSKIFGGFVWTRDFPEEVLNFVKAHPIMYQGIRPVGQRPLLMQTEPGARYSQIVVDRVEAEDGIYDVLFIGTDVGTILKVVSVPRQSWKDLEEVLLEEIQVLKKPEPILSMEISSKLQHLYVGSANSVTQLSLHRCTIYGKACVDCCLARDPYCAWDGKQCSRYFPSTRRRLRRQDVRNGDPLSQCSDQYFSMGTEMDNVEERLVYGVGNSTLLLECVPKSLQAHVAWMFSPPNDENREEVKTDDRVVVTPQGLLLRSVVRNDAGLYACRATEHSFVQTLARFRLEVIGTEQLDILLRQRARGGEDDPDDHDEKDGKGQTERRGDLAILDKGSSSPHVWYREFMRLVNHPSLSGGVAEICERARLSKKQRPHRRRKARGRGAQKLGRGNLLKWKHTHEARKRRNRRTHSGNTRPPRSIDA